MNGLDGAGPTSPRIERLRSELASGDSGAAERFWREARELGSPLVEPQGGGSEALATFLWRGGDVRSVAVLGPLVGLDEPGNALARLPGSDVWHRTYRLPADVRGRYWLSPDAPRTPLTEENWGERLAAWRRDPLNPETFLDSWELSESDVREVEVSVLRMPASPPEPWITPTPDAPAGTMAEHPVASALLGNERAVWVYTPAGYETAAGELGAVLLLDGRSYARELSAPAILDNLIAAGAIPPLIAVMPDSLGHTRNTELPCHAPFADFLADELLPWARGRYRIAADPRRTIVGGASYGGLAAAFAALRRPEVFGNVLSQSGSYWWAPDGDGGYEWLTRRFAEDPAPLLRFYLDVGRLETEPAPPTPSQLLANRRLRAVLDAKGYGVHYEEFAGGHDSICWRGTLPDGLIALTRP